MNASARDAADNERSAEVSMLYTTFGAFQAEMKSYYTRTGSRLQYPEMIRYMAQHGLMTEKMPEYKIPDDICSMSDPEFDRLVDTLPIGSAESVSPLPRAVQEDHLIPERRDVFIIRHPRYTRPFIHSHNYFEINYVVSGTLTFVFEKESRLLRSGELCVIAPGSQHDFYTESDDTIAFTVCIRKSTFNTTFFQQMSGQDLLSYFFRTILHDEEKPNYLLFFTHNNGSLIRYLRLALLECTRQDAYSNSACVNLTHLMFVELLRSYSQTVRFYNYKMGSGFSLVLQYLQHNYKSITLAALASFFHYSKPHLSTLIRKNTGFTFSELVKQLRLADAVRYLQNTDLKVAEIAETVGYHSADHFSRVFRSAYGAAPQEYRKNYRAEPDFIPFRHEETAL
ncbi:AraC family transcriptional regulator [Lachnoclostridium sp. Marseille-P6806]|uniref:AraC family transcriptional regulator n=1 Tax=Lachnoclostridium sp. Marseille-P6806 TaxID=2364793 RepID=UPI001F5E965F|nr:AraC family transcriptional regulator [Lachnoclostridium sp. Marseille-P6806]